MHNSSKLHILDMVSKVEFLNLPEQDFLYTDCLYFKITLQILIIFYVSFVQYIENHFPNSLIHNERFFAVCCQ